MSCKMKTGNEPIEASNCLICSIAASSATLSPSMMINCVFTFEAVTSVFFFFLGLSIGPRKQEAALHDSTDQNTPAAGTISSAAVENRMLTPVGGKMLYLLKEGKKTTFDYVWDGMRPCVNVASSLIPFILPFSHCRDCRWTFDKTFNSPFPEFPVGQGGINNSGSSFFFTKIFSLAIGLLCFAAIWHQQTELLR